MEQTLSDFLDDLASSENEQEAGRAFIEFVQLRGLDGANIWFGRNSDGYWAENSSVTTYSKVMLDYVYDPKHRLEIADRVICQRHPIKWGIEYSLEHHNKNSCDREFNELASEQVQCKNAYNFPIPTIGRPGSSGVSVYSSAQYKQFENLWAEVGSDMHIAALSTHLHIQNCQQVPLSPAQRLSPRERECLLWLGNGLSIKEIAHKLDIADVTVKFHFTNAKKKLSAKTREQALAKAILTGQITP